MLVYGLLFKLPKPTKTTRREKPIDLEIHRADVLRFPPPDEDLDVDVVVIGGGITGISTGYFMARAGMRVAVLEAAYVGWGTTGNSTGNLYVPIDEMYRQVSEKFDVETARLLSESRARGLEAIDDIIREHGIDCDFVRTSWNLIAETPDALGDLEKERDAMKEIGIDAELRSGSEFLPNAVGCLSVADQAQFNPKRYVVGLAKAAAETGCLIHENTRVSAIETDEKETVVFVGHRKIKAGAVVKATHTPIGEKAIMTLLGPYREYVVAAKLKSALPRGMYWAKRGDHHYSMRTATDADGEEFLLCLGEPHKVGQDSNNQERFRKIDAYMRERFEVGDASWTWGAQHYKSADLIPYIGSYPSGNFYVATGYSTDGLVYGTVAGLLLTDLIRGVENQWASVYDPNRINPLKSAGRFLKENINVLGEFVKGRVSVREEAFRGVGAGEGKVLQIEGKKFAVYRDPDDALHVVSAVCPHMGCIVRWNQGERSWGCPCHGSRFTTTGEYLEGPSLHDLTKITPSDT